MEEHPGLETRERCLWVWFSLSICRQLSAVVGQIYMKLLEFYYGKLSVRSLTKQT